MDTRIEGIKSFLSLLFLTGIYVRRNGLLGISFKVFDEFIEEMRGSAEVFLYIMSMYEHEPNFVFHV